MDLHRIDARNTTLAEHILYEQVAFFELVHKPLRCWKCDVATEHWSIRLVLGFWSITSNGCFQKLGTPQIIHFSRVFIKNHPFWGTSIFGNTQMLKQQFALRSAVFFQINNASLATRNRVEQVRFNTPKNKRRVRNVTTKNLPDNWKLKNLWIFGTSCLKQHIFSTLKYFERPRWNKDVCFFRVKPALLQVWRKSSFGISHSWRLFQLGKSQSHSSQLHSWSL